MTYRLKREKVSEKLFIYENLIRRPNFYCTLLYLNSEGIFENFEERFIFFFGYLYKNGTEGASCGEKWLLNRILHNRIIESTT